MTDNTYEVLFLHSCKYQITWKNMENDPAIIESENSVCLNSFSVAQHKASLLIITHQVPLQTYYCHFPQYLKLKTGSTKQSANSGRNIYQTTFIQPANHK